MTPLTGLLTPHDCMEVIYEKQRQDKCNENT